MGLFETIVYYTLISFCCAGGTGGIAVIVAMAIEVLSEG